MTASHTTSASGVLRRPGWALVPLAVAQLIVALDAYIVFVVFVVFVALPDMASHLGFSHQNLRWVISAYAVTYDASGAR